MVNIYIYIYIYKFIYLLIVNCFVVHTYSTAFVPTVRYCGCTLHHVERYEAPASFKSLASVHMQSIGTPQGESLIYIYICIYIYMYYYYHDHQYVYVYH